MHSTKEASERIRLRPATEIDLSFVLEVERDSSNTPFVGQWSLDEHRAALINPDVEHWIIESEASQTPVGYVLALGLSSGEHEIYLKRIVVSHKGRGIGRQALRIFHRMAFKSLGARRVRLVVRRNNSHATKLYLSEGYKEIGVSASNRSIIMALDLDKA